MDIKILDSWLRDHLKTEAKPDEIARALSLTSASFEKVEEVKKDFIYHVEVTTNRPDMASVLGLAREAAAVLPRFEIPAEFIDYSGNKNLGSVKKGFDIEIKNDKSLVRRICCVALEVEIEKSPQIISDRLEASGTRSLNNIIDITNYIMHEMGHPAHVFDYDRLTTKKIIIRPSKKGEKIVTLDKKHHILPGGDIVADNGKGEIIDLLGIMGTDNSVVTNHTKKILFFIDNNDPRRIRNTSMSLGIRTEAAGLNEKDVDPELALPTLLYGIELYKKYAKAKIISEIVDIYPDKPEIKYVSVSLEKINQVVGIAVPVKESISILTALGFKIEENKKILKVEVPSWRLKDIILDIDIIEEIARVFGYHNIPSELPTFNIAKPYNLEANIFYWEDRAKEALKYWGFIETYSYSMISEKLAQEESEKLIKLENPLDNDHVYLRKTLVPSLREIINENRNREEIRIFEIANIYLKRANDLPVEVLTLTILWKLNNKPFYAMKGIIEQLARDFGINLLFKDISNNNVGADLFIDKEYLGFIQILDTNLVALEVNFALLTKHATLKKTFNPIAKFPPVIEDLAFVVNPQVRTGDIINQIKKQSQLIKSVDLLDIFEDTRTFHIVYQTNKNLTDIDVSQVREKIIAVLNHSFSARIKN